MPTPLQQVEQNLAEIAVSQISEKNPNLLNYYLGFDVIDKNDDGTRAAGIMGFKIGGQVAYIPVFFLNGKVRGMEVMYLKNSDTFVANNEQWVNYIAGQNPEDIGHPAQKDQIYVDGESNNSLRIFSRPPASANSKAASLDLLCDISVEDFIDTELALNEPEHDLVDFLKSAGYETYKNFIKMATETPEIMKALSKVYDLDDLKIDFSEEKKAAELQQGVKEDKHNIKTVKLVRSNEILENPSEYKNLDRADKEKVITKGYAVSDLRGEDEKSEVYLGDFKKEFTQVTATGYYEILNCKGDLVKAMVFAQVNPVTGENKHPSGCFEPQLVVDPETGAAAWSKEPVYFRQGSEITTKLDEDEKSKVLKDTGSKLSECKVGKVYILVDKEMAAYGPFKLVNKTTDKEKVMLMAQQTYIPMNQNYLLRDGGNSYELDYERGVGGGLGETDRAWIRLVNTEDGKPRYIGNALFVPKNTKAVEVKLKDYMTPEEEAESEISKIKPGGSKTLDQAISSRGGDMVAIEKSATFNDYNVHFAGSTLSFRDRSEVVLDLMSRAGLSEHAAEKMASIVFSGKNYKVCGWTLPNTQKSAAYPDIITPQGAAGANRDGTPLTTGQSERQEMIPASPGPVRATNMEVDQWNAPNKEDLDFLQRASDSNSRQVFDPAMIGVIVRTSRSQSIVQEYVPELVDNLDRMCRLLLLFYWHNREFSEEYGIDEMADFEDLLLSTIKSTAKVVLFLKQRAVESSAGQTDVLE